MNNNTTAAHNTTATGGIPHQSHESDSKPLVALNSPEGQACLKEFLGAQFELNHDLNNPLAGVVGYLELALTGSDAIPERTLELLQNVQKCADRMDELIQEFVKSKRRLQKTVDLSDVLPNED